jgi:translation initiation factor 1
MGKKNKGRSGVVYSTDPDFEYEFENSEELDTPDSSSQKLKVVLDRHGRKGKTVTLVTGFVGSTSDLNDLAKQLKQLCGSGGSAKDGEVVIQGDMKEKISNWLRKEGYQV